MKTSIHHSWHIVYEPPIAIIYEIAPHQCINTSAPRGDNGDAGSNGYNNTYDDPNDEL